MEKNQFKCRECGEIKLKIFFERVVTLKSNYSAFKDENGKRWNKRQCPACVRTQGLLRKKRRSQVTEHKNKLGFDSEIKAKKYFEKFGFKVIQTDGIGPDLTLEKNDKTYTCEVKTITEDFSNGYKCYFCSAPYKARKNDDLIAFVHGENVWVEPMSHHVARCGPSGRRALTNYFRQNSRTQPHYKNRPTRMDCP